MESTNIINVEMVSVWDGGFKVTSKANLSTITGEVINTSNNDLEYGELETLEVLDYQYIMVGAERYEVLTDENGLHLSIEVV